MMSRGMKTFLLAGGAIAALYLLAGGGSSSAPPQPAPPGPAPSANLDVLRAQFNALIAQADVAPETVDPNVMDALADALHNAGLEVESQTVRAKAAEVRARQANVPVKV